MSQPEPFQQKPSHGKMECNQYSGSNGGNSHCEIDDIDPTKAVMNCVHCGKPLIKFDDGAWYKLEQIQLKVGETPEYEI